MRSVINRKKSLFALMLSIFLVTMLLPLCSLAQNLGCPDLSDCDGSATCGTDGRVEGCNIYCSDGSFIVCPHKGGGGGGKPPEYPE